jgi:hypothetical protein
MSPIISVFSLPTSKIPATTDVTVGALRSGANISFRSFFHEKRDILNMPYFEWKITVLELAGKICYNWNNVSPKRSS